MSHGDKVESMPKGFEKIAFSENSPYAAIANEDAKIYAFQFHPEVYHSEQGSKLLKNFAKHICGCESTWNMGSFAPFVVFFAQRPTFFGNGVIHEMNFRIAIFNITMLRK